MSLWPTQYQLMMPRGQSNEMWQCKWIRVKIRQSLWQYFFSLGFGHKDAEQFPSFTFQLELCHQAVLVSCNDFCGSEFKHHLWGRMCNSEVGNGKSLAAVILVCSAGNPRSIEIAALIRDPAWSCRPQEFDQSKPLRCRQAQVPPKWPSHQCSAMLQILAVYNWFKQMSGGFGPNFGHAFQLLSSTHCWT